MNLLFLYHSADPASSIWTVTSGEDLMLLMLALTLLTGMILIAVVATYLMLVLRRGLQEPVATKPADTRSLWQRFTGLHALSQEKDLVMDHAYDGILELDNPTPPWFMGLFYGTIGFGLIYLFLFHVVAVADLPATEYRKEMAVAELQRATYIKKIAGSINENTVVVAKDAKSLDAGRAIFTQSCVACHGPAGQGGVGPNLTDDYWLHGGSMKAVFHTISEGVPEKGMMSWKKQLNPLQVQQVASFILSLRGTRPANPKAPQGQKETPAVAEKVALN